MDRAILAGGGAGILFASHEPEMLETDRLLLRKVTDDDLEFVARMLADASVMEFYPRPLTRDEAAEWIARQRERYATDGHGLWLVVRKSDGAPLGQCGLLMQDVEQPPLPEIGYMLDRPYWHNGYASEAAAACRDYAFETLEFPRVISLVRPENKASQRVATRIGMVAQRRVLWRGYRHILYSIAARP